MEQTKITYQEHILYDKEIDRQTAANRIFDAYTMNNGAFVVWSRN